MRRREILSAIGSAIMIWPITARGERPAMPVVGFLRSTPASPFKKIIDAFRLGLRDEGYTEGENVHIEYRFADNRLERLPGLAAELVRRKVSVIVGNSQAVEAARAATNTIPIVFVTADDPVTRGLVSNIRRPQGNLTGLTFFGGGKLAGKRLELLSELLPSEHTFGVLQDPTWPGSKEEMPELHAVAGALGRKIVVVQAAREAEFESALEKAVRAGVKGLVVSGSPVFTSRRQALAALILRHKLPAIYDLREHVVMGGLMSYSASFADAYRQAGVYAGRILKGAKPGDLPVLQPAKFELTINLKTAKTLGIKVPQSILIRADEVIE